MKYKFNYKNTIFDFIILAFNNIYASLIGTCNAVFTFAMIILAIRFWADVTGFVRTIILFGCILFPIIQPLFIFEKAKKQAESALNIEIAFDEFGVYVHTKNESSDMEWNKIKKISKKRNMIIVFLTTTNGFLLTNRILGKNKKGFYEYLLSKVENI